ncbi:MAG: helicase, partial [Microbacterium sp.]
LAAADAASGAATGVPCERAAEAAASVGAEITACTSSGTVVTVHVRIGSGLLSAQARARAGPAPEE